MSTIPDSGTLTGRKRPLTLIVTLGLGLVTLLAYWGVWRNEFVNYDDASYVFENTNINHGLNWQTVIWAFTRAHSSNWHPLTWLSHALDCQLFGLRAGGHHAMSLGLHIANVILLFFALRTMTSALWRSALVAVLFGLHPLHVESVAWVAERKDVLSGFFFVLILLSYAHYARAVGVNRGKAAWLYGLTLLAYAFGLMSKPMLVTTPFLLLLLDYWPLQRMERISGVERWMLWRQCVIEKIPFLLLTVASCVVTYFAQGEAVATKAMIPLSIRLGNAALAYVAYLGQMVWPAKLAVFYPLPVRLSAVEVGLAVGLLAGVTIVATILFRPRPYLSVGWFWYLGTLVPVIGLVQIGAQARADRYTYLPLIGIFILMVWGVAAFLKTQRQRGLILSLGSVALVGALAILTQQQSRQWRTSETLFTHASRVTEGNYVAWGGLGIVDVYRSNWPGAMTNLTRALEFAQTRAAANNIKYYLGVALQMQGRGLEALPYLQESYVVAEMRPERNYRLGLSLIEAGRLTEAEKALTEALGARPDSVEYQLGMATLLNQQGQAAKAEEAFRKLVTQHPEMPAARRSLADFLTLIGRRIEAESHYAAAVKLKGDDASLRRAYAACLSSVGRPKEAAQQLKAALKIEPANSWANFDLAELSSQLGEKQQAVAYYESALAADPNAISALNNLAWLLATDADDAIRNGRRAVELAQRGCELTKWKQPVLMGTLAAAYAEANRFPDACATAERARDQARAAQLEDIAKRNEEFLELYRTGKPYRESK